VKRGKEGKKEVERKEEKRRRRRTLDVQAAAKDWRTSRAVLVVALKKHRRESMRDRRRSERERERRKKRGRESGAKQRPCLT
jgi:hypothetical protein